jgi:hypothetical protein
MNRREFLKLSAGAAALGLGVGAGCSGQRGAMRAAKEAAGPTTRFAADGSLSLEEWERRRVMAGAKKWMGAEAKAITEMRAERSPGGAHDYYSEADYMWPNPKDPNGPFVNRDGYSNPNNFNEHRHALIRLSIIVGFMGAAYKISPDDVYAREAVRHLRKWFLDDATRMNPNLEFAQRQRGHDMGHRIGIIDTVHLAEVAKALMVLEGSAAFTEEDKRGLRGWFGEYLKWLNGSAKGRAERDTMNNHATCWILQAGAFAQYLGDEGVVRQCRELLVQKMGPAQVAGDGSYPAELKRTKPYCYSLFNLNVMGMCAQMLSAEGGLGGRRGFWNVENSVGGSLRKSMAYYYPYIADKSKWPFKHDVMFWEFWPVQFPVLLFGGWALGEQEYVELWKRLDPDPTNEEVIRNMPVRQPVLWGEGAISA